MDASYKIQRGIHVHLIQFFMCPEFWVHITSRALRFCVPLYQMRPEDKTHSSSLRTARNASVGICTDPRLRIFFLPSFCFSSSFFFRVMSPP